MIGSRVIKSSSLFAFFLQLQLGQFQLWLFLLHLSLLTGCFGGNFKMESVNSGPSAAPGAEIQSRFKLIAKTDKLCRLVAWLCQWELL
jgi:hypothetical protein